MNRKKIIKDSSPSGNRNNSKETDRGRNKPSQRKGKRKDKMMNNGHIQVLEKKKKEKSKTVYATYLFVCKNLLTIFLFSHSKICLFTLIFLYMFNAFI
jgi:hypothetical protein